MTLRLKSIAPLPIRACEDCGDAMPAAARRIRCKNCGTLSCGYCHKFAAMIAKDKAKK